MSVDYVGASSFAGNIGNSGVLFSQTYTGMYVYDIAGSGKFTGSIFNSGTITSYSAGMWIEDIGYSGFTGGIINSGNINSLYDFGLYAYSIAEGNGAVFSGSILNSGHITAASDYGMYISAVADSQRQLLGLDQEYRYDQGRKYRSLRQWCWRC